MYVYINSEHSPDHDLYTVGFYAPDGKWNPESDWATKEEAAKRVHYLNGGINANNEAINKALGNLSNITDNG